MAIGSASKPNYVDRTLLVSQNKLESNPHFLSLTAKYGKPSKKTEQVTNGLGTKFDKEIFTWSDSRGAQIAVESLYRKIDEGRIVIDSASSVAAKKAAEKSQIKAGKENL